jgi:CRISPR/Cas system CMR subunit Cmr4 (Cas7 group RAMP superfamily)
MRNLKMTIEKEEQAGLKIKNSLKEFKYFRNKSKQKVEDSVNSPAHYNNGDIECIDAIEAMLTSDEFIGYLRGNSLKYRWRFRYKNEPVQDMLKATWYEEKLLQFYKKINIPLEKQGEHRQKN